MIACSLCDRLQLNKDAWTAMHENQAKHAVLTMQADFFDAVDL